MLSAVALLLLAFQGCGRPPEPSTEAILTYGYSPIKDAAVAYQPDVVVIEGGAAAIRSVSGDGLVWTLDRAVPGVNDLEVGKVMFAASNAVGRVVEVHDRGENRVVILAPVDLTEIFRDAEITLDQNIDLDHMIYQLVPDQPGKSPASSAGATPAPATEGSVAVKPPGHEGEFPLPPVHLVVYPALQPTPQPSPSLPPARTSSVGIPLGDAWTVKPYSGAGKLGLSITRKASGGLKASVDLALLIDDNRFHIGGDTSVENSGITSSDFVIQGITGLQIGVAFGVANASSDNAKVKFEVPVEVNFPVPSVIPGVPMNIKVTYTFLVETALVGNNSTLLATGTYKLDGPLGITGGKIVTPSFSVQQSILDSISGLTLGPSGVVVGMKLKVMAGLGTPAATVGPYGTFTDVMGMTNGSSLGAPLARCRGATLDLKVGGGIGLSVSPSDVLFALKNLVSKETKLPSTTKIEHGIETSTTFLHRDQVIPDVPLCRGG